MYPLSISRSRIPQRPFSREVIEVLDQGWKKETEPDFGALGVAYRHPRALRVVQRLSCKDDQITAALHRNDDCISKDLSNRLNVTLRIDALGDEVHHKDSVCPQDLFGIFNERTFDDRAGDPRVIVGIDQDRVDSFASIGHLGDVIGAVGLNDGETIVIKGYQELRSHREHDRIDLDGGDPRRG